MAASTSYRTGVHMGNWHEDALAAEHGATATKPVKFQGTTEARSQFKAPAKQQSVHRAAFDDEPQFDPIPASQRCMPRHLLFGHGFDAHDTSAVSGDAFMSVSQVAHSKSGVKMDSIIQGSKGTSSLGPRAPKTRTERSRMRAKMLAAGIDSTDPRGAQGSSNPKPTPVAFSGGGTYTTMNQLTQKPMQKAARLSRAAGRSLHLPDEVEHKPKVTAFTRSFGNRTAQVLMRR